MSRRIWDNSHIDFVLVDIHDIVDSILVGELFLFIFSVSEPFLLSQATAEPAIPTIN